MQDKWGQRRWRRRKEEERGKGQSQKWKLSKFHLMMGRAGPAEKAKIHRRQRSPDWGWKEEGVGRRPRRGKRRSQREVTPRRGATGPRAAEGSGRTPTAGPSISE